jgi:hypothetical protein
MMTIEDWEFNEPIDDNEEVVDKREFLDENGVNIFTKKSKDKTVEERIKTSRSLKIKHNKWNQVDYTEDFVEERITVNPQYYQSSSSFEDVEFEKRIHEIIKNSKYSTILLGDEKVTINYQVVNDIIIYCYARLKNEYTLVRVFVIICEYCGIGLQSMWKRLSSYLQMQILQELSEVSKLPRELLENDIKLF